MCFAGVLSLGPRRDGSAQRLGCGSDQLDCRRTLGLGDTFEGAKRTSNVWSARSDDPLSMGIRIRVNLVKTGRMLWSHLDRPRRTVAHSGRVTHHALLSDRISSEGSWAVCRAADQGASRAAVHSARHGPCRARSSPDFRASSPPSTPSAPNPCSRRRVRSGLSSSRGQGRVVGFVHWLPQSVLAARRSEVGPAVGTPKRGPAGIATLMWHREFFNSKNRNGTISVNASSDQRERSGAQGGIGAGGASVWQGSGVVGGITGLPAESGMVAGGNERVPTAVRES